MKNIAEERGEERGMEKRYKCTRVEWSNRDLLRLRNVELVELLGGQRCEHFELIDLLL